MNDDLPMPLPADTARLDQIGAQWREADPRARQDVADAAARMRGDLTADAVTALMDALSRAGMIPKNDEL
ncbi:hypothetical protein AB0C52_24030 [Streptomyces sp. NPDC048717]|uniref:hypothetical protein n=1 Tax=Streptomyces sp. NPDC048717 TaxID=3154928 RepID=UPI003428EF73